MKLVHIPWSIFLHVYFNAVLHSKLTHTCMWSALLDLLERLLSKIVSKQNSTRSQCICFVVKYPWILPRWIYVVLLSFTDCSLTHFIKLNTTNSCPQLHANPPIFYWTERPIQRDQNVGNEMAAFASLLFGFILISFDDGCSSWSNVCWSSDTRGNRQCPWTISLCTNREYRGNEAELWSKFWRICLWKHFRSMPKLRFWCFEWER